jgi:hypothetical protein
MQTYSFTALQIRPLIAHLSFQNANPKPNPPIN